MKEELKILREHIRGKGLKQTTQRESILRIFLDLPDYLSVDEIGRHVQSRDKRIGLSTVYRTLKLFVDAGLAWEHQFWQTCFEKAHGRSPHNYLICTRCLRVEAFSDPLIDAVRDKVAGAKGFKPSFNRMEVYGLCRRCRGPFSEDED
jgi:Fur family transcriptional regulator, ferric uptake regulator